MRNGLDRPTPTETIETILVVDEGELSGRQINAALRSDSRQIIVCPSVREALHLLPQLVPDLIIASLTMPDLPGLRLLEVLTERAPETPVIATCSSSTLAMGVQAARKGAIDVLERPIKPGMLAQSAEKALVDARKHRDADQVRENARDRHGFSQLLTQSPRMLRVFDQIRAVAGTDATVLIRGETGTGKELVSRAIHERSRRRDKPFISVNCGAFTETLLESELFGHEKGSFTGAGGRREGVFEMADGGTLFLDELGETSLNVQVNLLRVLEEMRFRRVGGHDLVNVDVRIVAATNADLEVGVRKGSFREDLFYRLNVFPIHLPPLRERPEDIPLLTRHFLEDAANDYQLPAPVITPEALQVVLAYKWPGNVRQLRSLCERWVIVAGGREVTRDMLPRDMFENAAEAPATLTVDDTVPLKVAVERATAQVERAWLHAMLKRHGGRVTKIAKEGGITRRTLYNKLKQYGLEATDFRRE